ncbi:hypothetical protein ExPUPEC119_02829 [Escherichia coli]|nr:hypothetical protein HmCmsJML025_03609 [Escherichia coli]GDW28763.1 hypothetical protein ExPUPEC119_02829 [Escherichia coli]
MVRLQAGGIRGHPLLQLFQLIFAHCAERIFPAFGAGDTFIFLFGLKSEFVVQEFVQECLSDNFEFVTVVAQAVVRTDAFQAVDQGFGFVSKFQFYHVRAPVLNSFRYSATIRRLMSLTALEVRVIWCSSSKCVMTHDSICRSK